MASNRYVRLGLIMLTILALAPLTPAAWIEFVDESAARMSSASHLGLSDNKEKDYAWGDVDKDGDIDLVVVRKEEFTSPGKDPNVLFLNQNGVLTDQTTQFASASSVSGDQGFLTPTNDRDVILADLNNDGWLDMVTATTISDSDPKHIGHPRIYMNLGCSPGGTEALICTTANWQGFFYDEPRIPQMDSYSGNSNFNPRFCSVSAGDLTGDGYADLYFGDYDSSGSSGSGQPSGADYNDKFLVNQGALNPGYFVDVTPDPARFQGTVPQNNQSFEVSAFGAANAIRDMNGDFVNDIVKQTSLQSPTYVGIAYNGNLSEPGYFDTYDPVNQLSPYHVTVGDLNNDNDLDLVISDDGDDRYMLNGGSGFVPEFISYTFAYTNGADDDGFGSNSLITDLDKDGWNDVLIADVDVDIGGCSRRMHIYRNLTGTPGDFVTLREETEGTGCANFNGNPASCLVASIPSNKLEGVHDVAVFDINGDTWDDMVVGRCSTTEIYISIPDGSPAGGVAQFDKADQLLVGKSGGAGNLALSWGDSCVLADSDYGIYEGRIIAPFNQHGSMTCSTGGSTTATISPAVDSSYYLIVPNNGAFEGDYGQASGGLPRGQGSSSCLIQNVGVCE